MLEENSVYKGDCLRLMRLISDNSIDMILCDLPYGQTASMWDKSIDIDKLWKLYNRIIKKERSIVLFSAQPFTTKLIMHNEKNFRYCWYWIKNQGTNFFHAKIMPIRKIEEICVFNKGKYYPQITEGHIPTSSAKGCSNGRTYYGNKKRNYDGGKTTRYPNNTLYYNCVDNYSKLHSQQKPINLCEYLIKTYTKENDLVLDNCAGSGTTAIACINTNRRYILIEKEEEYIKVIKNRIKNHE